MAAWAPTASIQPSSGRAPGSSSNSHSLRAAANASATPCVTSLQPAASATSRVSSSPGSAITTTSPTTPSSAPGTSAANVSASASLSFLLSMTTETMACHSPCGQARLWNLSLQILFLLRSFSSGRNKIIERQRFHGVEAGMSALQDLTKIAFRQAHSADMADYLVNRSSLRVEDERRRGRGAGLNPSGRFEVQEREIFDDGWETLESLPPFKTQVEVEKPRTIITRNASPDISFDRSINPYRGCEHGCIYCFARPTHSYMGLSAGLDFESKLFAKPDAAKLLEKELSKPGYKVRTIAIGTNTDPYQPVEREWRIMRQILEVLSAANHPVGIVTKSALVMRDLDILAPMAEKGLAKVALSVTTLDRKLARAMEPRAATPPKRLEAIRALTEAGVPASVMTAPIIPGLNDHEIERILDSAAAAGATEAGYVLLRLPHEVSPLFRDWLLRNYPDRYRHVMSLVRSMRDGKDYDAEFGKRMKGAGPYAWQLGRRFSLAAKRLGLNTVRRSLRTDLFAPPAGTGVQLALL
jgi:DNA repair photolyase